MTDLVAQLVGALEVAVRQGEHDMLLTGEELRQCNAALSAAKDGGWLPIETAPKDGTEVFVYVPGDSLFPTAATYKSADYFEKEYGDREYMEEGWYWAFGYAIHHDEDGPVYLEEMEPKFEAMKSQGVPATEHITHQRFWAQANKIVKIKASAQMQLPCECTT